MPEIPKNIQDLLELAGPIGSRPLDRLERGKPFSKGIEVVAKLSERDLGTGTSPQTLLYLKSALYIYFDGFDEAHHLVDKVEGPIENWLHAIVHRREPDASNSKYWYQRVQAPEEVFHSIASQVVGFSLSDSILELEILGGKMARAKTWLPEVFVDICERFREKDPGSEAYRGLAHIQEIEWRGLLEFILKG